MSSHPQFTVAEPLTLSGIGLHSGEECRATLMPSEAGRVVFLRDGQKIPAAAAFVSATARCTTLSAFGASVSTVEHLLASLSAMAVTSVEIDVSGPELPILDGSAASIVRALRCAGLRRLSGDRPVMRLTAPVWLEDQRSSVLALPSDRFRVTVMVDYAHARIGRQVADVPVDADTFAHEIAEARTFGFEHEVEELIRRGLARGGSLDNALIFMNDGTSTPLRFPDEPARHKVMDVIGDLSLIGSLPLAHVITVRPSHRLNVAFARRLLKTEDEEGAPSGPPREGDTT